MAVLNKPVLIPVCREHDHQIDLIAHNGGLALLRKVSLPLNELPTTQEFFLIEHSSMKQVTALRDALNTFLEKYNQ